MKASCWLMKSTKLPKNCLYGNRKEQTLANVRQGRPHTSGHMTCIPMLISHGSCLPSDASSLHLICFYIFRTFPATVIDINEWLTECEWSLSGPRERLALPPSISRPCATWRHEPRRRSAITFSKTATIEWLKRMTSNESQFSSEWTFT